MTHDVSYAVRSRPRSSVTIALSAILLLVSQSARGESPILGPNSTVDDVLDGLQSAGKDLKTFTATVKITDTDLNNGTETYRHGTVGLKIKSNGDAQLHLVLTDRQFGKKKPVQERKEYILNDGWVADRDFTTTTEVRRQIARSGTKVDLFQLGKGPFPLPIGQDRKDVESRFDVTISPPDKDDPAGSIHLVLTPKAGSDFASKYKTVEVWVDPKLKMPVRVSTTDSNSSSLKTTDLTDMKINPDVPDEEFKLPPLDPKWQSHDEPLKK